MQNPIRPTLKTEIIPIILILISIPLSFYFYANFPDRVPTHWNFAGEVDGWSSRGFAAFFFPALIAAIYLMMLIIPYADPKRERYDQFKKIYHLVKLVLVIFFVLIYIVSGLIGIGYNLPIKIFIPTGVGLLFIILGNYLGKVKQNWFMGIRTPWTLSSDIVWNKTHRLGGKLFIVAGLIMILGAFIPAKFYGPLFIIGISSVLLIPIIYSYIIYRQEKK